MTAQPSRPAAVEPLDEQAIARLRELDPHGRSGVVVRILQTYESALLREMAELVEAGDRGDARAVFEIAHKLKSSSQSIGALAMARVCAEIEHALREATGVEPAPHVERLLAEGDRALVAVRAMLRT
jgi:HPt (histidine-containing phosphotransfer) domain-containing protein